MTLYTNIFLLFHLVVAEWVEIVPITSSKTNSGPIETSTSNYDIFLTTSFTKNPPLLTTAATIVNSTKQRVQDPRLELSTSPIVPTVSTPVRDVHENLEVKDEPPYQAFLPFLQMVQKKLLSYKFGPHNSKISVMRHLRDHLLKNIHERITNLWTRSDETEARSYKGDDSMEFPSNEGALMTIGFLTFAVFLIKLVIKLVEALKYKTQDSGSNSTTTAASIVFIQRQRDINEKVARISRFIDEYEYH